MHHILKYAVAKFPAWELQPIPTSTEKFLSLIVYVDKKAMRFIDSYAFLTLSLAKLADNMVSLPLNSVVFDTELINGKGTFPYNFASSLEVLASTTALPPRWGEVTEVEYAKAQQV